MAIYDDLKASLERIDDWLVANPTDSPTRQEVFKAREVLSDWMNTIEDMDLRAAMKNLTQDAQQVNACTAELKSVAKTLETAQTIIDDVGKIADALENLVIFVPPKV
jgi:hypothetical protein